MKRRTPELTVGSFTKYYKCSNIFLQEYTEPDI